MKAYKVVENKNGQLKSAIYDMDYGVNITTLPLPGSYLWCFRTIEDALEYLNFWRNGNLELWECEIEYDGYQPEIEDYHQVTIDWDMDDNNEIVQRKTTTSWYKTLFAKSCRLTEQIPLKYFSVIHWADDAISTDRHPSIEAAKYVMRKLEQEGMGLEGKVFPLSTVVEVTI